MQQHLHDWHAMLRCAKPIRRAWWQAKAAHAERLLLHRLERRAESRMLAAPSHALALCSCHAGSDPSSYTAKDSMYSQRAAQAEDCIPSLQHTDDTKSKLPRCMQEQGSGNTRQRCLS